MNDFATDDTGFVVTDAPAAEEPPVPRRRGRPKKDASPETAELHAASEGNAPEAAETDAPKRRKSKGSAKDKAALWTQQIQGFYGIVAAVTGVPFLAVSEAEAKQLANAGIAVAEEYDFEVAGKYAAIGGLVVALAMSNVPRALMFRQHLMMVRQTQVSRTPEPPQPYVHNAPLSDGNTHPFETMPKVDPGAVH